MPSKMLFENLGDSPSPAVFFAELAERFALIWLHDSSSLISDCIFGSTMIVKLKKQIILLR
jgi:hypothetical protein